MLLVLPSTSAAFAQTTIVVPSSYDAIPGTVPSPLPFGSDTPRYQQAYSAADLVDALGQEIAAISFRLDGSSGFTGGHVFDDLKITLSTKPNLVDQLTTEFHLNPGPNEVVVYDAPYVVPDLSGGAEPLPFELRIPLTTLFNYGGDDLLVDMRFNSSPALLLNVDAVWTLSDGISRSFVAGSSLTADSLGLVTAFELKPPPAVKPMSNCGGNLGTLAHVSGEPTLGSILSVEMDAAQALGAIGYLAVAIQPVAGWPPCGVTLPPAGELLISAAAPNPVLVFGGGTGWSGAPLPFVFPVPVDLTLIGVSVYTQGAWVDVAGAAPSEPLRLTGGLELTIGQ
ncbi:MAG: hypothetical protein AAF682_23655 [Planctomycetota bacterium]